MSHMRLIQDFFLMHAPPLIYIPPMNILLAALHYLCSGGRGEGHTVARAGRGEWGALIKVTKRHRLYDA